MSPWLGEEGVVVLEDAISGSLSHRLGDRADEANGTLLLEIHRLFLLVHLEVYT